AVDARGLSPRGCRSGPPNGEDASQRLLRCELRDLVPAEEPKTLPGTGGHATRRKPAPSVCSLLHMSTACTEWNSGRMPQYANVGSVRRWTSETSECRDD